MCLENSAVTFPFFRQSKFAMNSRPSSSRGRDDDDIVYTAMGPLTYTPKFVIGLPAEVNGNWEKYRVQKARRISATQPSPQPPAVDMAQPQPQPPSPPDVAAQSSSTPPPVAAAAATPVSSASENIAQQQP